MEIEKFWDYSEKWKRTGKPIQLLYLQKPRVILGVAAFGKAVKEKNSEKMVAPRKFFINYYKIESDPTSNWKSISEVFTDSECRYLVLS